MCDGKKKNWSSPLILGCLILAIAGSFAFSASETLGKAETDKLGPAGFFSFTDHGPDWLAENTSTVRKASRYPLSTLRNGFFRVFASIFIFYTAICFLKQHYLAIKNDNTIIYKNNILLKLRI